MCQCWSCIWSCPAVYEVILTQPSPQFSLNFFSSSIRSRDYVQRSSYCKGLVSLNNQSKASIFPCSFSAFPVTSLVFLWYSFSQSTYVKITKDWGLKQDYGASLTLKLYVGIISPFSSFIFGFLFLLRLNEIFVCALVQRFWNNSPVNNFLKVPSFYNPWWTSMALFLIVLERLTWSQYNSTCNERFADILMSNSSQLADFHCSTICFRYSLEFHQFFSL